MSFLNDLKSLKKNILVFLKNTIDMHSDFSKFFKNKNSKALSGMEKLYTHAVSHTEEIIDNSQWLLIKLRPVSRDLRKIICYISIAQQIERIFKSVSRMARLSPHLSDHDGKIILELDSKIISILKNVYTMIENWDLKMGIKITSKHKEVHEEYIHNIRNLYEKKNKTTQNTPQNDISFILCLKYIERCSDHIVDIYELVYYILKAEFIHGI